nr:hypothetical protein Iba_chr01aCG13480 [Ipomoea batatas]
MLVGDTIHGVLRSTSLKNRLRRGEKRSSMITLRRKVNLVCRKQQHPGLVDGIIQKFFLILVMMKLRIVKQSVWIRRPFLVDKVGPMHIHYGLRKHVNHPGACKRICLIN